MTKVNDDLFPARRKLDMMIKKNKMTDMMRMITMAMKTTMIMTNLLPAGEKLRPDQLGVELLFRRLEGACLVRRKVKISLMISWSRVLIIFLMTTMTSLARMISWTQMLTSWSSIKKIKAHLKRNTFTRRSSESRHLIMIMIMIMIDNDEKR